eukprot:CAMPEP_0178376840 /NCGR_PEP_ID=MMETSP0689_2-20121128/3610_1 /TAXON_ID=160604 /ORGANISM="Amphidinium massartii, Strain CS-259" /LENGTH=785 /DNA_ID=CAMNT_0019996875 /DNA_START=12 /DNA_END=2370 /DNA_ORIENTATION=-
MEIAITQSDGVQDSSIISIRAAGTRRQAPVDTVKAKALKFPDTLEKCCAEPVKIDIYVPVATARLVLQPTEGSYKLNLDHKDAITSSLGLVVKNSKETSGGEGHTAQASSNADGPPSRPTSAVKYQDAAASAREYLEEHGLLRYIQSLLHAVIQVKPKDPYEFMGTQLGARVAAKVSGDFLVNEVGIPLVEEEPLPVVPPPLAAANEQTQPPSSWSKAAANPPAATAPASFGEAQLVAADVPRSAPEPTGVAPVVAAEPEETLQPLAPVAVATAPAAPTAAAPTPPPAAEAEAPPVPTEEPPAASPTEAPTAGAVAQPQAASGSAAPAVLEANEPPAPAPAAAQAPAASEPLAEAAKGAACSQPPAESAAAVAVAPVPPAEAAQVAEVAQPPPETAAGLPPAATLPELKKQLRDRLKESVENGELEKFLSTVQSQGEEPGAKEQPEGAAPPQAAEGDSDLKTRMRHLLENAAHTGLLEQALGAVKEQAASPAAAPAAAAEAEVSAATPPPQQAVDTLKSRMRKMLESAAESGTLVEAFESIQRRDGAQGTDLTGSPPQPAVDTSAAPPQQEAEKAPAAATAAATLPAAAAPSTLKTRVRETLEKAADTGELDLALSAIFAPADDAVAAEPASSLNIKTEPEDAALVPQPPTSPPRPQPSPPVATPPNLPIGNADAAQQPAAAAEAPPQDQDQDELKATQDLHEEVKKLKETQTKAVEDNDRLKSEMQRLEAEMAELRDRHQGLYEEASETPTAADFDTTKSLRASGLVCMELSLPRSLSMEVVVV